MISCTILSVMILKIENFYMQCSVVVRGGLQNSLYFILNMHFALQ